MTTEEKSVVLDALNKAIGWAAGRQYLHNGHWCSAEKLIKKARGIVDKEAVTEAAREGK